MEEITISNTSSTNPKIKIVRSQDKLNQINQQLADIRKKLSDRHAGSHPRVKNKKNIKPNNLPKKSQQKSLHHPKLDFVLGEVVYSPYMTKPLDPYPHETFEVPKKLHELKKKLQTDGAVPKEELPYDVEFVKDRFLHEVANFSVSFNMTAEEKSPLVTARSRSGLRSPFSRQNSLEEGCSVDEHSFFAKSSMASASMASLPPVQSNRRVPSSSGMRANSLKSSSHDSANVKSRSSLTTTSSLASTKRAQQKTAPKEVFVQNGRTSKADMAKSLDRKPNVLRPAVKPTERLETKQLSMPPEVTHTVTNEISFSSPKESSLADEDSTVVYEDDFSNVNIVEETCICPEKIQSFSTETSTVAASVTESPTSKPTCALSQSDLELLMNSFAMVSYHMGR